MENTSELLIQELKAKYDALEQAGRGMRTDTSSYHWLTELVSAYLPDGSCSDVMLASCAENIERQKPLPPNDFRRGISPGLAIASLIEDEEKRNEFLQALKDSIVKQHPVQSDDVTPPQQTEDGRNPKKPTIFADPASLLDGMVEGQAANTPPETSSLDLNAISIQDGVDYNAVVSRLLDDQTAAQGNTTQATAGSAPPDADSQETPTEPNAAASAQYVATKEPAVGIDASPAEGRTPQVSAPAEDERTPTPHPEIDAEDQAKNIIDAIIFDTWTTKKERRGKIEMVKELRKKGELYSQILPTIQMMADEKSGHLGATGIAYTPLPDTRTEPQVQAKPNAAGDEQSPGSDTREKMVIEIEKSLDEVRKKIIHLANKIFDSTDKPLITRGDMDDIRKSIPREISKLAKLLEKYRKHPKYQDMTSECNNLESMAAAAYRYMEQFARLEQFAGNEYAKWKKQFGKAEIEAEGAGDTKIKELTEQTLVRLVEDLMMIREECDFAFDALKNIKEFQDELFTPRSLGGRTSLFANITKVYGIKHDYEIDAQIDSEEIFQKDEDELKLLIDKIEQAYTRAKNATHLPENIISRKMAKLTEVLEGLKQRSKDNINRETYDHRDLQDPRSDFRKMLRRVKSTGKNNSSIAGASSDAARSILEAAVRMGFEDINENVLSFFRANIKDAVVDFSQFHPDSMNGISETNAIFVLETFKSWGNKSKKHRAKVMEYIHEKTVGLPQTLNDFFKVCFEEIGTSKNTVDRIAKIYQSKATEILEHSVLTKQQKRELISNLRKMQKKAQNDFRLCISEEERKTSEEIFTSEADGNLEEYVGKNPEKVDKNSVTSVQAGQSGATPEAVAGVVEHAVDTNSAQAGQAEAAAGVVESQGDMASSKEYKWVNVSQFQALSTEERKMIEIINGDINLGDEDDIKSFADILPNLRTINGSLLGSGQLENLGLLESVGDYFDLSKTQVSSLGNLKSVKWALYVPTTLQDLGLLESVGSSLDLSKTQVSSLGNLKSVKESLFVPATLQDLGLLESVGSSLYLSKTQVSTLGNLKSVKGGLTAPATLQDLGELTEVGYLDLKLCKNLASSEIDKAIERNMEITSGISFPSSLIDNYSYNSSTKRIEKKTATTSGANTTPG